MAEEEGREKRVRKQSNLNSKKFKKKKKRRASRLKLRESSSKGSKESQWDIPLQDQRLEGRDRERRDKFVRVGVTPIPKRGSEMLIKSTFLR